jgi:integrase
MKGTITKNSLKKTGKTSWGYVFDKGKKADGRRDQETKQGFGTRREAEEALRGAISLARKAIRPSDQPFGEFFKAWLIDHGQSNWGLKTQEENAGRANYAIRKFGNVPLSGLTAQTLEQSFNALKMSGGKNGGTLSAKTVKEVASLVNQALIKARKWKLITENPMEDVDKIKLPKRRAQSPQIAEFEKYLGSIVRTRYYVFSAFCAAVGCRRGEALAVTWADIDWDRKTVMITKSLCQTKKLLFVKPTKTEDHRILGVSDRLLVLLRQQKTKIDQEKDLYGDDYEDNDLLFARPDGGFLKPDRVTGRISEFMARAGVAASLHSLRHMNATVLLSAGVSVKLISERLGHSSSKMTLDIYSHILDKDQSAAIEAWDRSVEMFVKETPPPVRRKPTKKTDVRNCEAEFPELKRKAAK